MDTNNLPVTVARDVPFAGSGQSFFRRAAQFATLAVDAVLMLATFAGVAVRFILRLPFLIIALWFRFVLWIVAFVFAALILAAIFGPALGGAMGFLGSLF